MAAQLVAVGARMLLQVVEVGVDGALMVAVVVGEEEVAVAGADLAVAAVAGADLAAAAAVGADLAAAAVAGADLAAAAVAGADLAAAAAVAAAPWAAHGTRATLDGVVLQQVHV
ncbi:uncharacterized protein Tco025E_02441 [Trypanosoma conorhini]|uniref:Uncharacterized protein n=1 Tax=Trypanosoma conorhini TaxID=83891 RepID=A0A3S5IU61_9TRYP|nr:uncharacterized protein Tco025E_02441 [Trypanosoma conorhini]RNF24682.1 hypothetical protein Tco025E_02441 [Trypanosoma conorhini]